MNVPFRVRLIIAKDALFGSGERLLNACVALLLADTKVCEVTMKRKQTKKAVKNTAKKSPGRPRKDK